MDPCSGAPGRQRVARFSAAQPTHLPSSQGPASSCTPAWSVSLVPSCLCSLTVAPHPGPRGPDISAESDITEPLTFRTYLRGPTSALSLVSILRGSCKDLCSRLQKPPAAWTSSGWEDRKTQGKRQVSTAQLKVTDCLARPTEQKELAVCM